jgi:hypothetical protein
MTFEDTVENIADKFGNMNYKSKSRTLKIVGGVALAAFTYLASSHSTGDNEIGVRTRKIPVFGQEAIVQEVYPSGATYFFVPFVNDWHTFTTNNYNMRMQMIPASEGVEALDERLIFKTRDGNDIALALNLELQLIPEKAPDILDNVAETTEELWEKVGRTIARSKVRDFYGMLSSEEFYAALKRNDASEHAKSGLDQMLEPYGVRVVNVAAGDYDFLNPEYANMIKSRILAETNLPQLVSNIEAQKEANKRRVFDADQVVNKTKATADGTYQREVVIADSAYLAKQATADAIMTEGRNQATGVQKMREAMVSGGGDTQVQMQIVKSLQGKRIVMVPQLGGGAIQTFNVNDYLRTVGIQTVTQKPEQ